jgi:hypothetical protein
MMPRTRNNRVIISPYEALAQQMKAREFCRRWFGATLEDEQERGYREKCVVLLSKVLHIRENTIQRWGKGLDFEKMPEPYEVTLAYADIIREMIEAVNGRTEMIDMVLAKLRNAQ